MNPLPHIAFLIMLIAYALSARNNRILKEQNQELKKSEHIKDSLWRNCNSKILKINENVSMYEEYLRWN